MHAFPVPTVVAACPAHNTGLWPSRPGLSWPESGWPLVATWPVSLGLPASRVSLLHPDPTATRDGSWPCSIPTSILQLGGSGGGLESVRGVILGDR